MLQIANQNNTASEHYLTATSSVARVKTMITGKKVDMDKPVNMKVPTSLTEKLNNLAKCRPFNILHRVKKYDPL